MRIKDCDLGVSKTYLQSGHSTLSWNTTFFLCFENLQIVYCMCNIIVSPTVAINQRFKSVHQQEKGLLVTRRNPLIAGAQTWISAINDLVLRKHRKCRQKDNLIRIMGSNLHDDKHTSFQCERVHENYLCCMHFLTFKYSRVTLFK